MAILVTGGAGYIGSHACVELLAAGREVVVVDNLSNSRESALDRVREIAGRDLAFHCIDVGDRDAIADLFRRYRIESVIHFAGLKAVGESVAHPLRYYRNNLAATATLCEVMADAGVKRLVFSSSATVYGDPHAVPITEDFPLKAANPYGRTKLMIEEMLHDVGAADPEWRVVLLRYFNPVGAHESGRIGEDPRGIPNNLLPYVAQVAVGRLAEVRVFGGDYPTPDGTGVRDYLHVVDLAVGHLRALDHLDSGSGVEAINLGTGRGHSVLEVIRAFERASGIQVPYRLTDRRPGDVAECWADPARARQLLGWVAERDLDAMCRDAWNWQRMNPEGYPG
jgi:UDP-glucose 4-epimerase